MKTLKLVVLLTFSTPIIDKEIPEVAENVRKALINQIDNFGLAPDSNENYTTNILITCPHTNLKIEHKL
jgi:hypothetical protein